MFSSKLLRKSVVQFKPAPSCLFATSTARSPIDDASDDIPSSSKGSELLQENSSIWGDPPLSEITSSSSSSSSSSSAEQSQTSSTILPEQERRQTRRIRYNGKYPKQFTEKYKELNGDTTTIQKVLQKGMTPAGRHIPIMINECMEHLQLIDIATEDTHNILFVDCTLGYGGHSTHVLQHLLPLTSLQQQQPHHRMICFDRDPIEIAKATERLQMVITDHIQQQSETFEDMGYHPPTDIVTTVNRNFCELRTYLDDHHCLGKATAVLADLGLSSMQIDDASRGFTYKYDGPLDMRMTVTMNNSGNNSAATTESAYDLLQRINVAELTKLIQENSDEFYAPIIAQAILGKNIPSTTLELANIVREAVRPHLLRDTTTKTTGNSRTTQQHQGTGTMKKLLDSTVARVMQAIRIEVNSEFDALQQLLDDLPYILSPTMGRAVFLTFHSGEDRRVKKSFKQGYKDGIYSSWSRDVVRPTSLERYNNPRSSCCKLRWVVRSDKPL